MVTLPCTLADWAACGIIGQVHYGQRGRALPYQRVLAQKTAQAQALIAAWWEQVAGHGYIALSYGKDSLVTWHLAQQVAPIPAIHIDMGPLTNWPDCLALAAVLRQRFPACLFREVRSRPYLDAILAGEVDLTGHHPGSGLLAETAFHLHQAEGWRGFLWGLRGVAEPIREGRHREILLRQRGALYRRQDGLLVGMPVGAWRTEEIWAYLDGHKLPYPAMYDVDRRRIRNGPMVGMTATNLGRVRQLRQDFPAIYRLVSTVMPEVFARHA